MGFLSEGKQIHGNMVKLGYVNIFLQDLLLNVYIKCKEFTDAHRLLAEMRVRNVVAWNMLICRIFGDRSEYKSNLFKAFSYLRRMLLETVNPDDITFNALFRTCIELNDVESGKQLHCYIVKLGFDSNCFVSTALIDLYAKCGLVEAARRAFDYVLYRDLILWNVMVYCYASNCMTKQAFGIFRLMQLGEVKGDEFTFSSLLNLCSTSGYCNLGEQIHGIVINQSFDLDVLVASAVVDMYAKNGNIGDARKAFDKMVIRNVVSWTTMIVSYGKCGEGKEAFRVLRTMFKEDFYPDELTLASVVSSCGNEACISELMQVHACTIKLGFQSFLSNVNALINAYSKCGSIANACQCFSLVGEPDLFTWTSIICAYAFHGFAKEAVQSFEKMLNDGIVPDRITFLGVLSACSHGGMVNKGLYYFKIMINEYQIVPHPEHYTCIIDLIGRAGFLSDAFSALTSMSTEAGPATLGAFLGACKIYGKLGLAEWAAEKLLALEPKKPVNYVLMSNMYSYEGHWTYVARIRQSMTESCDHKAPGCSWIEIAGDIHAFVSSDKCHPRGSDVYDMLSLLFRQKNDKICILHFP